MIHSGALRLIVVDDNPDDRALAIREIRKVIPAAVIDEAGTREAFEALLAAGEWDVAITDFRLRWASGIEVLRRLRAVHPELPVIMFTASGSEEVAVEAMKEGLDDYITKTAKHYGRVPYAVLACAERARQRRTIAEAQVEQRAVEARLRASEDRFRAIQETSPDGFMLLDAVRDAGTIVDFAWTYVNEAGARLTGRARDWFEGRRLLVEQPSARETRLFDRYVAVATTGEPWVGEVRHVHDGHEAFVRLAVARVGDGVAVAIVDLSARRRAELALKEADRQKNEFLATLAHELRNPMTPIRYAAALLRPDAPAPTIARARETIERQAAQMARLLDDLLDMSRITRNVIELRRETLDLRQVVAEAVDAARPEIDASGHRLAVTSPAEPVWVDGDALRLQQVVGNLLSNAVKYTPPGGRIDVAVDRPGPPERARLRVTDTGVGLSEENLGRVFNLFSQVHRGLTASRGGLGIGLAVAKRLTELHDGTIAVRSDGLGRGTEFSVTLPLAGSAPPPGAAAGARPALQFEGRPRVLVVDDNRDAADSLAALLATHGLEVMVAYDGASTIARAEAFRPTVVMLDVGLPDMSGIDVARVLRARDWAVSTTIVAVTGWGQDEDRRRTRDAGVDLHLVKPVDPERLLEVIAALGGRAGDPDDDAAPQDGQAAP